MLLAAAGGKRYREDTGGQAWHGAISPAALLTVQRQPLRRDVVGQLIPL